MYTTVLFPPLLLHIAERFLPLVSYTHLLWKAPSFNDWKTYTAGWLRIEKENIISLYYVINSSKHSSAGKVCEIAGCRLPSCDCVDIHEYKFTYTYIRSKIYFSHQLTQIEENGANSQEWQKRATYINSIMKCRNKILQETMCICNAIPKIEQQRRCYLWWCH